MKTAVISAVLILFSCNAVPPQSQAGLDLPGLIAQAASVPRDVQRWQDHCNKFRAGAEQSLAAKRGSSFPFSPLPGGTSVEDVVRNGIASPVYVGGASHYPGSQNLPVFFQDFTKNGQRVQLYAYQRKNGQFVTFDVSGDLGRAYSSNSFTNGLAGSNSVLGLPNSGRQILNPQELGDWHVTAFRATPEVSAKIQAGQAFGYQEFEGGLLAEVSGGVQAFRFDASMGAFHAMGTPFPLGNLAQGGFAALTPLAGAAFVHAGHFMLNGQPFKQVGGNLSQLVYDHPDRIWDELTGAQRAGIRNVRVFLPNSALTTSQVGDRLAVLLSLASALGMKVTVALTSFARQEFYTTTSPEFLGGRNGSAGWDYSGPFAVVKGDEPFFDWLKYPDGTLVIAHPVLQNAWFQQGYQVNFRPFAATIVERFKDDPAIFAWEIANETKSYGLRTTDAPDFAAVKAFYADLVALVRAKAPRHLVTAGLTNSREFVGTNEDERRNFLRQFDFVSIHQYANKRVPENQSSIDTDVRLARELGRPVVLGEFGFFDGVPSEQELRAYVTQAVDVAQFDSIVPWAAGPYGEDWWKTFGTARFAQVLTDTDTVYQAWNQTH